MAVDVSGWMYLAMVTNTRWYKAPDEYDWECCVDFVVSKAEYLFGLGMELLLVFDGAELQAKVEVAGMTRAAAREAAEDDLAAFLNGGGVLESEDAKPIIKQLAHRHPDFTALLKQRVARQGISHLTSPYEADAQCAYLGRVHQVDAVVTGDADLLVFGSDDTIFDIPGKRIKMRGRRDEVQCFSLRTGHVVTGPPPAVRRTQADLPAAPFAPDDSEADGDDESEGEGPASPPQRRRAGRRRAGGGRAAAAGQRGRGGTDVQALATELCKRFGSVAAVLQLKVAMTSSDYAKGKRGLGAVTALRAIEAAAAAVDGRHPTLEECAREVTKVTVSGADIAKMQKVLDILTHQVVWDPVLQRRVCLTGDDGCDHAHLDHCGDLHPVDEDEAAALARGEICPTTGDAMSPDSLVCHMRPIVGWNLMKEPDGIKYEMVVPKDVLADLEAMVERLETPPERSRNKTRHLDDRTLSKGSTAVVDAVLSAYGDVPNLPFSLPGAEESAHARASAALACMRNRDDFVHADMLSGMAALHSGTAPPEIPELDDAAIATASMKELRKFAEVFNGCNVGHLKHEELRTLVREIKAVLAQETYIPRLTLGYASYCHSGDARPNPAMWNEVHAAYRPTSGEAWITDLEEIKKHCPQITLGQVQAYFNGDDRRELAHPTCLKSVGQAELDEGAAQLLRDGTGIVDGAETACTKRELRKFIVTFPKADLGAEGISNNKPALVEVVGDIKFLLRQTNARHNVSRGWALVHDMFRGLPRFRLSQAFDVGGDTHIWAAYRSKASLRNSTKVDPEDGSRLKNYWCAALLKYDAAAAGRPVVSIEQCACECMGGVNSIGCSHAASLMLALTGLQLYGGDGVPLATPVPTQATKVWSGEGGNPDPEDLRSSAIDLLNTYGGIPKQRGFLKERNAGSLAAPVYEKRVEPPLVYLFGTAIKSERDHYMHLCTRSISECADQPEFHEVVAASRKACVERADLAQEAADKRYHNAVVGAVPGQLAMDEFLGPDITAAHCNFVADIGRDAMRTALLRCKNAQVKAKGLAALELSAQAPTAS